MNRSTPMLEDDTITVVVSRSGGGPAPTEIVFFKISPGNDPLLLRVVKSDLGATSQVKELKWILDQLVDCGYPIDNVVIENNIGKFAADATEFLRTNMRNAVRFSEMKIHKEPQSPLERAFMSAVGE